MKSQLKATVRGIAAGVLVLLTGCGGGGDAVVAEPPAPEQPGNPDTVPIDAYPSIRYQYFLGDDYGKLDANGRPLVWSYQVSHTDSKVTQVSRTWPAQIVRPKVAPTPRNMTFAYGVLKERNGLSSLAPDRLEIRQLTNLTGPFCDRDLPEDSYFIQNQSYFYGITLANAGIYTFTPGADGQCHTGDDDYWEVPVNARASDAPKRISREIAYAQELLDSNLNLLGFLYAEPGQTIKTYDAQGNPIKELGAADSYVTLLKHYDGNLAVLVLGTEVYFVDTQRLVSADATLPQPVFSSAQAIDPRNLVLDTDRLYLIEGATLVGISYQHPSQEFVARFPSVNQLSFGNRSTTHHGRVFSNRYIYVRGDSPLSTRHLFAVSKQNPSLVMELAQQTGQLNLADDYFATGDFLYFSSEDASQGDAGYKAYVWQDTAAGLQPRVQYDLARWFFYQNHTQDSSKYQALLMEATIRTDDKGVVTIPPISAEGGFYIPSFYSYDPFLPDAPSSSPVKPRQSGINRPHGPVPTADHTWVREISDAESGHLLLVTQTLSTKDPLNVFYSPPPNKDWKPLKTAEGICERGVSRNRVSTSPPCGVAIP